MVAKVRSGKGRGAGAWVRSRSYRAVVTAVVDARKAAGQTQRELAAALGKPPSFVAKVEQLERRLDVNEFIAIARALKVKEVDLLRSVIVLLPKQLEY